MSIKKCKNLVATFKNYFEACKYLFAYALQLVAKFKNRETILDMFLL
jgi:hypothetical protein